MHSRTVPAFDHGQHQEQWLTKKRAIRTTISRDHIQYAAPKGNAAHESAVEQKKRPAVLNG